MPSHSLNSNAPATSTRQHEHKHNERAASALGHAAFFSFGHFIWGAAVVVGRIVVWVVPAYYVGWKLRQRG